MLLYYFCHGVCAFGVDIFGQVLFVDNFIVGIAVWTSLLTYSCRYRVCLVCSDGTAAAEFVMFGRIAQQVVGKSVLSLMKNDGVPREIAAMVIQKFTFSVSISQKKFDAETRVFSS